MSFNVLFLRYCLCNVTWNIDINLSLHLLHAHCCAALCSCARGTVLEVFEFTSHRADIQTAVHYVLLWKSINSAAKYICSRGSVVSEQDEAVSDAEAVPLQSWLIIITDHDQNIWYSFSTST